jgi:CRISPR-associated endoribonuclease Cas6
MRIAIKFTFKGELKLPKGYNNLIQAFIYSHISNPEKRDKLHNYGYVVGPKKIKLMTFSRLFGEYNLHSDSISFKSPVTFVFSSYDDDLVSEVSYNLLTDENTYLNGTKINVVDLKPTFFDDEKYKNIKYYVIEMLSPVTVYSTGNDKKKIYFNPWSKEFGNAIKLNIETKLHAININDVNIPFNITPNNMKNSFDEKIIYFKDTLIKGYNGIFTIRTNSNIMKLIYYAGIGSKNSEGFGCFKILGDKI